jgi:hypothetical protein
MIRPRIRSLLADDVVEARVVDVDTRDRCREGDAAVDQDDVLALLEGEAVHPDFPEPPEGDQPERVGAGRRQARRTLCILWR